MELISDAARALIGTRSDWAEACHPVEASEARRFFQAIMDDSPRYRSEAAGSRYGGPVAPPGFPVHAFRRPASDATDPLEGRGDPEFDGSSRLLRHHLPRLPIALEGVLNGGYEYEFFSYARVGERIFSRSTYRDLRQREGRSGPMVLVIIEDEYAAGTELRPLLRSIATTIIR
ncbi:MaoC family dehydratase [Roseomonas hellenica]|uniref:MaoC family dehydratase n=1 Tax=Plastoroseomonas hellenica TaxID=2687306 RepID=A0ABS5F3V7_9PROT|nr:MaoC family dehydratase N-terminal domain-containing protein [Plastoroseomonas hellenica]MBR0667213.1 MaoC family dehydratase [Plastoroseomonas hellenica]